MADRSPRRERAAAAVEFALLLPVLLLVIGGIVDFGRFFYTQNVTVNAAREGARMLALGYPVGTSTTDPSAAKRVGQAMLAVSVYTEKYCFLPASGGPATCGSAGSTIACPASPLPGDHVSTTVTVAPFSFMVLGPISSLFGSAITVPKPSGTADVRCGG